MELIHKPAQPRSDLGVFPSRQAKEQDKAGIAANSSLVSRLELPTQRLQIVACMFSPSFRLAITFDIPPEESHHFHVIGPSQHLSTLGDPIPMALI